MASSLAQGNSRELLAAALDLDDATLVFPWQHALLETLRQAEPPSALDLPTGLGKTSVIAIWLLARALGARIPRRLVYVVDRRAVVDQATAEAERLRAWVERSPHIAAALDLDGRQLPISTLRGQHVDNREWLEDPSIPAIIIGTVDMIGSRLLFEGYAASRKIRPYHAALLACDSLVVIDEAHIIPSFEALIASIPKTHALHAPTTVPQTDRPPPLHVLSLTATQRAAVDKPFTLTPLDTQHPVLAERLHATKRLRIAEPSASARLVDDLVTAALGLYEELRTPLSCIVYCDSRDTATSVANEISKRGKSNVLVELFVGARRVRERVDAESRLIELGFVAGQSSPVDKPRYLVATSAAEVGVDLDAEHAVCDVVPWERMVQRFGRVNRRGLRPAHVRVIATPPDKLDPASAQAERRRATLELLKTLPMTAGGYDASPAALRSVARDHDELVRKATTPAPLHPALDRATLDAWAMTSLPEHPGRPRVGPWLRGWVDEEPQVSIVWRRFLPAPERDTWTDAMRRTFVEALPPHTSEVLDVEVSQALRWLKERVARLVKLTKDPKSGMSMQTTVAISFDAAGEAVRAFTLAELVTDEKLESDVHGGKTTIRRNATRLERDDLPNATFVVDARMGGLLHGLLKDDCDAVPVVADDEGTWLETEESSGPVIRFRVGIRDAGVGATGDDNWRERLRQPWVRGHDGDVVKWIVVEKWRHDAATEEDRSAGRPQLLRDHHGWTEERVVRLGKRLGLDERAIGMLRIAARLHDEGKRTARWQRAMRARADGIYAKTRGPAAPGLLGGYRHELGSLTYVEQDAEFKKLHPDDQDLVLHLVAAHHGFARPLISASGMDDVPPSLLQERARGIAARYFRLSERFGPWGLAWWESLLRAADQQASRDNDFMGGPR